MGHREITGSLAERNGRYTAILNLYDEDGKRRQKSIALGVPVKGNKRKAQARLEELKREYSTGICNPEKSRQESPTGHQLKIPVSSTDTGIFLYIPMVCRYTVYLKNVFGELEKVRDTDEKCTRVYTWATYFYLYLSPPLKSSPAASTLDSNAAIIFVSQAGIGAPIAPAFSMMLPASVRMYQITTRGHNSTV